MILLTILLLTVALLTVFAVFAVGTVGAVGFIVFGDVIVCIVLLIWIIKRIIFKKKKH